MTTRRFKLRRPRGHLPRGAGGVRCLDCNATAAATGRGTPIVLRHNPTCPSLVVEVESSLINPNPGEMRVGHIDHVPAGWRVLGTSAESADRVLMIYEGPAFPPVLDSAS